MIQNRRTTRGGGGSTLPFFENWKKMSQLEENSPDCAHGLIKVLSRLKNSSFSIVDFEQVNISWGMIIHEQTIQANTIIETTE